MIDQTTKSKYCKKIVPLNVVAMPMPFFSYNEKHFDREVTDKVFGFRCVSSWGGQSDVVVQLGSTIYIAPIIQNRSKLPTEFVNHADEILASITFAQDDILKIIQNLDLNKYYCPDKISSYE